MKPWLPVVILAAVAACDGYADLDVPVREEAALTAEEVDLHPGALGRVQVAVNLPSDAAGPAVVVGPPAIVEGRAVVENWAFGPCRGFAPADGEPDLRLCVAVRVGAGERPTGLVLGAVVESRADARRFTVGGEVPVP